MNTENSDELICIVPFKKTKRVKANYLETDERKIPIGVTYRAAVAKAIGLSF